MSRSKLMAIVFLTWKAALRYRFFWVMLVMLAGRVTEAREEQPLKA